jgi:hypothetical protein
MGGGSGFERKRERRSGLRKDEGKKERRKSKAISLGGCARDGRK